uniref:Integrase, catalytic region, zinc finger, CCHC-type, peptidase aspartic, catalytic n=1 Tax=Tanacetum cinerariifolium TaxID=118510 RepID=A0A6L2LKF7_TANCI|nr:integrase, catalytic region, zinc finger, CCHC-type, peptidase aspartic, catalytic [Tanacetum cinerariifolium]
MSTDKESSDAGTDNRPPMPTLHPQITVTEGQGAAVVQLTKDKMDEEFTEIENNRELADFQATNILSQGLRRHVFNILNQTRTRLEIWENVELLMKGTRGTQSYVQVTDNKRKLVISYNCHEDGHVSRQCKEKKKVKDSEYFKDKMLLMEAKEKRAVLDAEAEAFLTDVECIAPYDQPLAIMTTNNFEVSYEDAYDSDVDEGPYAATAFMANLSSTSGKNGATTSHVNEVHTDDNQIFDNMNHLFAHEMHQEEHQDSDVELDIDDNTIPYHQYLLDSEVQDVSTEVSYVSPAHDLHKIALCSSNPWYAKHAKIAQPTLYDGHALLKPTNTPVRVHDSEESLVHAKKSNLHKPVTPFVHTHPASSKLRTQLLKLKDCFPAFETVIKLRTTPTLYEQGEWRFVHTKKAFTKQVIPFYEHVKELVQSLDENIVKEVTEFMQIFVELDKEYEQCVLEKKKLQIEKKNLFIQNECLITDCIEKDIFSIVLASDRDRPLSEELSLICVKENSKVIELEAEILKQQQILAESDKRCSFIQKNHINLQIKFRNYKECLKNQTIGDNSHSLAFNAIFEINQLTEQLQGKDDTIIKLQTQINSMSMLNVEPTVGSFDKKALETKLTQLKDAITLVRIQNDGFKVENVNLKRCYQELSTYNSHSRDTLTRKITALTAENAKLKSKSLSKMHSEPIVPEKPKVLAPGMYSTSSKYIVPPRRVNRAEPTPLPKKKQDTFQEPLRPSNRPTQKIVVQQNKKPNIHVNLSKRVKPTTEASKPMSKSDTQNYSILPAKREKAKRVKDHHRNLNKQNHVDSCLNVKRCSRHMIGDRLKLTNYVDKFIGTVRFENDQFAVIVGYGDYKLGNTIISRVYYVKGLSHNLFLIGQFYRFLCIVTIKVLSYYDVTVFNTQDLSIMISVATS